MAQSALRAPALVGLAGVAAALLLRTRDPNTTGSYGLCPFLEITGQPCPGCGGLRAVHALAHGDVVAALSSNLLAVVLVVVVTAAWLLWVVRRARGGSESMLLVRSRPAMVILAVVVVFGVVRVTPWGSWLAP